MTGSAPPRSFSDADLKVTLRRAMRTVGLLTVILFAACWFASGWRAAMLLLIGAVISLAGLFEWQRLVAVINARLDNLQPPDSTSFVVTMFLLRLAVAGGLLYGSLKCFQTEGYGSIVALAAGLSLAVAGLCIEAVRTLIF